MASDRRDFIRGTLAGGLIATTGLATTIPANAQALTPAEAKQIAEDAYVYGYSLITTEVTRVQMSNVAKVERLHAPMDQFANVQRYPPADYRGVSAPNADTLYSLAWLDLARAAGVQPSGHGQALLPVRDGRSLDDAIFESRPASAPPAARPPTT